MYCSGSYFAHTLLGMCGVLLSVQHWREWVGCPFTSAKCTKQQPSRQGPGPLSSYRQHLSHGGCLAAKREYCQNCWVLCCVWQLCTTVCTQIRTVLKFSYSVRLVFVCFWRFSLYFCVSMLVLLPSVLWCCWLGGRKGIRPVENKSGGVLVWLSVWSEVQTCIWPSWCHCHSLSCFGKNADWFYLSGTGSPE